MDILKEEYLALKEEKEKARDNLRVFERKYKDNPNYKWTRAPDGKVSNNVWLSVFVVAWSAIFFAVLFGGAAFDAATADVGDSSYHLAADAAYTCPECEWQGDLTGMDHFPGAVTISQDWVYYYCPECGHPMGHRQIDERQG